MGPIVAVPGGGEPEPTEQRTEREAEPRQGPAAQRADKAAAGPEAGAGVHRAKHGI